MAVFARGSGQLLVIGYTDYNFDAEPDDYYEQISDEYSLMGLQWRLHVHIEVNEFDPAHPLWLRGYIIFEYPGGEGKKTAVYVARIKLSVLLPNGQLVAEHQGNVRQLFSGTRVMIDGRTNHELDVFLGHPGQFLCESFTLKAHIEAYGEPSILYSPDFNHAIEIGPFEEHNYYRRMCVSGYVQHLRRLVFWIITVSRVTCWAANPLVPSSLEKLCQRETQQRHIETDNVPGALSHDQHLAACISRNRFESFHLYILVLGTNNLLHRRYEHPAELHLNVYGLAHTRRGWIMFTQRAFYLLAVKSNQMELLIELGDQTGFRPRLGASYNSLVVSYRNENRFEVWDLGSAELNSRSYCHQFDARHSLRMWGEKLMVLERAANDWLDWEEGDDRGILSMVHFEHSRCRGIPCCLLCLDSVDYIGFDEGKLFLVDGLGEEKHDIVVQTVWMPGRIPTAKEMATIEIQKRTGRQKVMQTALGDKSVWKGGITEQMITEILLASNLPLKSTSIMN